MPEISRALPSLGALDLLATEAAPEDLVPQPGIGAQLGADVGGAVARVHIPHRMRYKNIRVFQDRRQIVNELPMALRHDRQKLCELIRIGMELKVLELSEISAVGH